MRIAKIALVIVLVVTLCLTALTGWLIARGFPQREGTARLPGLSDVVRVVRDAHGIAHIYAATSEDLFAAQGYVHASERMWQMEVWRRIGMGRLAELFGESQLDTDRFVRALGWRQAAEIDLVETSPEGRMAMDSYARGVNAWLEQHDDLPIQFVIAGLQGAGGGLSGFRPEPWTALDSLIWQKVQAWSLGGNWEVELFRLLLERRGLPAEQVEALFPAYDLARPVVVPTASSAGTVAPVVPSARGSVPATTSAGPDLARLFDLNEAIRRNVGLLAGGSNAIAVSPTRSATGGALLANDPHLGISMPSVWFLVGLHCNSVGPACPYDVVGAGFPGGPGVVLGHNRHIAWGLTNVGPDVQDLFEETLDPDTPGRYIYRGQSRLFDVHPEVIEVAGGESVEIEVRSSVHGPVISDAAIQLRPAAEGGHELGRPDRAYALAWTAIAEPDRTFDAVLAINRARNWNEFRAALRDFAAPSQAFVYADVEGNIGVQIPGRFPLRAAGDGSVPAPGEHGSHDWLGWVPFDELPFVLNPASGIVVSANNLPAEPGRSPYLGSDFDPGWRAQLIHELVATAPLDTAGLRLIQGNATLSRAAPVIAALTGAAPGGAAATTDDGRVVLQRITDWREDLGCATESLGCAAYETFEYRLLRAVFDDELGAGDEPGDLARRYVASELAHEVLTRLVAAPDDAWWDDISTPDRRETMADAVGRALDEAGADLRATLGDPAGWTWGRIHTVTFREQSLGESGIWPLELLLNSGPHAAPGGCTIINKICGSISADYPPPGTPADLRRVFAATSHPSYRLVVDMADLDGATILQATGQSGLPLDGHYGDFIARWLGNEPLPVPFTGTAVEETAKHVLTLAP